MGNSSYLIRLAQQNRIVLFCLVFLVGFFFRMVAGGVRVVANSTRGGSFLLPLFFFLIAIHSVRDSSSLWRTFVFALFFLSWFGGDWQSAICSLVCHYFFLFFWLLSISISPSGIWACRAEGDHRDAEDSEHRRTDGHPGGTQWPGPPSQRYEWGGDQRGCWADVNSSDVLKEAINTWECSIFKLVQ